MSDLAPLILTLALDQTSFGLLDDLRRQHFPPERNLVPAHVTLFHALPGAEEPALITTLQARCAATSPIPLAFTQPRFLGRGVALAMDAPALLHLRQQLTRAWLPWLTPQDRQLYQPHVTIQNKVPPEQARQLMTRLATSWTPRDGQGEGLVLWRYLGGPWKHVHTFGFAAAADSE